MDFFSQQERARRNTRYLVVLFALATLLIIVLVNVLVTALVWFTGDYNLYVGGSGWDGYLRAFSWDRSLTVAMVVGSTIGLVSMVRWMQLSSGGKTVAQSLGGRRIKGFSDDPYEQRCLNVVEELALAANMPVPALYVLPSERGINAFAAGQGTADAVVAVTRGTLLQLNREELQGVIGHEFSHILNGDMRLGIRLAALLKGITFIGDVGHFLLRVGAYSGGNRRDNRGAALPMVGLGLLIIGWLGSLAAGFIKAAISRQKEYLADASAVQFTRDTQGIANALKVIGGFLPGSLVHAARAPEMSHIFFGEVRHHLWEGFATHPPLEQRIQRLDKKWDGQFIERAEVRYGAQPLTENMAQAGVGRAALVAAAAASVLADEDFIAEMAIDNGAAAVAADALVAAPPEAEPQDTETPPEVEEALLDPLGASAIALGMLCTRGDDETASLEAITAHGARGQADAVRDLLPLLAAVAPGERFPLIARAMPALREMSTPQYRQFKSTLLAVIRVDRRTDLFEWCLFQLIRHYLDPEYLQVERSRPRYRHLEKVRGPLRQVLSVLAHQGAGSSEAAFAVARDSLDLHKLALLPLEQCSVAEFSRSVHELADCYPLLKPRILKAMALAAQDDGEFCATERELMIAVAAVMDCPLPDDFALS